MTSGQISLCNLNKTADVALWELEVKGRQVCSSEGRIDGVQRLVGCIDGLSWLVKSLRLMVNCVNGSVNDH